MTQNLLSDYYTTAELAQELGISVRTLHRWSGARIGPPQTSIGQKVLYKRSSVIAWLEARERAQVRAEHQAAGVTT